MRRPSVPRAMAAAMSLALLGSCGEGLAEVALQLSKNCNEVQIEMLAARVGDGDEVLDVAADGTRGDTAWLLVHRPSPIPQTDGELFVQRIDATGVVIELLLPLPPIVRKDLSLHSAPSAGQVWVVRDEPGVYELLRIDPDDPDSPVLGSDNLSSFPLETTLCAPCDQSAWPRYLAFLPTGPVLVSVPPFSIDAGLIVWVGRLDLEGVTIRLGTEHRLNFEPPCEDESPEGLALCEELRMNLSYPEVTILGIQQDPRQPQTSLFGHRTRRQTYDGEPEPLESSDVFMVAVFPDSLDNPAGVLRSYSGFYDGPSGGFGPALPTIDPPSGIAIDRFAAYGLFSNGGDLARLVQLPNSNPDFVELSDRLVLPLDGSLLQLDRDLALGRIEDGQWEVSKLFPDDPSQSKTLLYGSDAPIDEAISGGIGTFLLRKQGAPPEVVRLRCLDLDAIPEDG